MKNLERTVRRECRGILFIAVLIFGFGVSETGLAKLDPVQQESVQTRNESNSFKLVRTMNEAPIYPRIALNTQTEGWVDILVTVSSNGRVENMEVVAAQPRRVF